MLYQIPCSKGKGTVPMETDDLPEAVYAAALQEGLKILINTGKAIKAAHKDLEGVDLEKAQAAALAQAQANAEELLKKDEAGNYIGDVKLPGQGRSKASGKVPGAVMTEARRLAKAAVKDELKRAGEKPSHYKASEITRLANLVIEANPSYVEQAKANLTERSKLAIKIDLKATAQADPELVSKAAVAAAKRKKDGTLSATQAGKVAPRAKPQVQPQVRH